MNTRRPLVIAHRGASGDLPENTWSAFERAVEDSADMIETDLHSSRDGVVVIHHDATLERLGAEGEIRDHTASELARLDASLGRGPFEALPGLLELLDRLGSRIAFNLELKVDRDGRSYPGMEEQVVAAVNERGLLERMLFSSFDDGVLARVRRASSGARIAVLVSPRAPDAILERADRVAAEAINPHCFLVTPELVDSAHEMGLAVYPYTANEIDEMTRLLDCGVDGIITNHPARLRGLIEERSTP